MASEAEVEHQFAEAFRRLLSKSFTSFNRSLLPFYVSLPAEFYQWEETRLALDLAMRAPALHASIGDETGTIEERINGWLVKTIEAAMRRYEELQRVPPFSFPPPLGAGQRPSFRRPRMGHISREVVAWAKATSIPYVTTARLSGIAAAFTRPAKVEQDALLRRCKDTGLLAFIPSTGVCLEMREDIPRAAQPTKQLPQRFLSCLQLLVNKPVGLDAIQTRPAIPVFDQQGISLNAPPLFAGLTTGLSTGHQLTTADVVRTRGLVKAFSNLHESGFDLALDLYVSHLHREDRRERAVDIAIALENLFLQREKRELSYRFSLHVAAFGRRLALPDRVPRRVAEKLYSARSDVVHGEKPSEAKIQLLISTGARLVRATLIAITSKKNREFLQHIGARVDDLINP